MNNFEISLDMSIELFKILLLIMSQALTKHICVEVLILGLEISVSAL